MADTVSCFEGCLVGVMIGDSVGSCVENASTGLVAHRYPAREDLLAIRPGSYGSTTEMTAALAASLAAQREFDGEDFSKRLLAGWHEGRGYGQGTTLAILRLKAGVAWQDAGAGQAGRGCYGNAAAARGAAVGLVHADDPSTLRWVAEEAAGVTHTHAHGVEGAVILATAVALALETRDDDFDAHAFFEELARDVQVREFRTHLEIAASLAGRSVQPDVVVERLGNNQTALGSVVSAALCFADHPDSFDDAAVAALRLGGNASAIVAMTLAMSGARLGIEELPREWIDGLETAEVSAVSLQRVARVLAR